MESGRSVSKEEERRHGLTMVSGRASIFLASTLGLLITVPVFSKDKPIPVKVVVITMFERGADTGDEPGELQYWVERNHLDRILPFPQGFHDLRMKRDCVLAVLS